MQFFKLTCHKILDGNDVVKIFGDECEVRAQIKRLGGYSGHGNHNDLVGFAHNMVSKPARTFIVHAEIDAAEKLQTGLKGIGLKDVVIPDRVIRSSSSDERSYSPPLSNLFRQCRACPIGPRAEFQR